MMSNEEWNQILVKNRPSLVDKINLESALYTFLESSGVIDRRAVSAIKTEKDEYRQKEALLDYLAKRPKEDKEKFCKALIDTNQKIIVDEYLKKPVSVQANTVTHGQQVKIKDQAACLGDDHSDADTVTQYDTVAHGTSGAMHNLMASTGTGSTHDKPTKEFKFVHSGEKMWPLTQSLDDSWNNFKGIVDKLRILKNETNQLPLHEDAVITVAVVDSGLDENHSIFEGRQTERVSEVNDYKDEIGHGTACAGIISYLTPQRVKILSTQIAITSDELAWMQLHACLTHLSGREDVDIVSISLGSSNWPPEINNLIRRLTETKIVISSAGNMGNLEVNTLQAIGGIFVGSCNMYGRRSDFSSKGENLFCLAPGEKVPSARSTTWKDYSLFDGTSFACPFVAAVAANILVRAISLAENQADYNMVRSLRWKSELMANILKKMCVPPENGQQRAGPFPDENSMWTSTEGYGILNRWDMLDTRNNNKLKTIINEIIQIQRGNQPQPS